MPRPPSSTALDTPAERIERLVREAFAIYERGAPELHVIRNEPERPPERRRGRRGARGLARRARRRGRASRAADRAVVRAMIDLGTWQALRDQGVGPVEAVDAVSRMLAA